VSHPAGARNSDVAVIIPMYNEASVVQDTLDKLSRHFANLVVVDDGSCDGSSDLARAAGARVVQHGSNLGAGAALRTGIDFVLRATDSAYIVTFDADGQHRVEDAVAMVDRLRAGDLDIVLGSRFLTVRSDIPAGRRRLLRAGVVWTRLTTRLQLTDTHNGLRAFTTHAATLLDVRLPGMAHGSEVLNAVARNHMRYEELPTAVTYSAYTMGKGQRGVNAVNILYDLAVAKVRLAR
jgi:polyprenyl-phospho-N-acetylgalactosaminyl synthase